MARIGQQQQGQEVLVWYHLILVPAGNVPSFRNVILFQLLWQTGMMISIDIHRKTSVGIFNFL